MNDETRDINLEKQIDAYIKGDLKEEEIHQLWIQLLKKPEYISLLETEIDLTRFYEETSSAQNNQNNTYYWKWIASAAAIVILAVGLHFFFSNAQINVNEWSQGRINLVDNLASAEVTRSDVSISSADSLLNQGFSAAISGKTHEAMEIYHRIIKQYGNTQLAGKAYLNMGILQYNSGDYDTSAGSFIHARTLAKGNAVLSEQIYWYLGNAYIHTKEFKQARDAIQKASSLGERYKDRSFKLLKWLDYKLGHISFDDFSKQVKENN